MLQRAKSNKNLVAPPSSNSPENRAPSHESLNKKKQGQKSKEVPNCFEKIANKKEKTSAENLNNSEFSPPPRIAIAAIQSQLDDEN